MPSIKTGKYLWGLGHGAGEKNVAAEQQLSVSIYLSSSLPSPPLFLFNKNDDVIEQRKMYGPRQRRRLRLRLGLDLDCSHVKS